jgi:hypothetical protein
MNDVSEKAYLWNRRHSTVYRMELSSCYHRKRERFFDIADKLTKAIAIVGGSVAFANVANASALAIAGITVALTSTLALVFGFADRAKRHSELARNFHQLEAEIVRRGERDFTEEDLNSWDERVRLLEASEPPALDALVVVCQNEIAVAQGQKDKVVPLPPYVRVLAHFLPLSGLIKQRA